MGISDDYEDCPSGSYCPTGSKFPTECAAGTFNPTPNAWLPEHCEDCPPGHYCATAGLSNPTEECSAGYYCHIGAIEPNPDAAELDVSIEVAGTTSKYGPCPEGHYCPKGTAYPFKCPPGTYRDSPKATSIDDCLACDAGYYGESAGMTISTCTGKCAAGYWCASNSTMPTPVDY